MEFYLKHFGRYFATRFIKINTNTMKKLYAIMCLSLILSVITHVSFANEKGKEVKTDLSIDVPNDSCNVSVVDYSTVIVVAVENTDTNEVLYGFTPTGYLIFKNQVLILLIAFRHSYNVLQFL